MLKFWKNNNLAVVPMQTWMLFHNSRGYWSCGETPSILYRIVVQHQQQNFKCIYSTACTKNDSFAASKQLSFLVHAVHLPYRMHKKCQRHLCRMNETSYCTRCVVLFFLPAESWLSPGHPRLHFSSAHFRPDVAQELLGWTFLVFGMVRGAV